MAKSKLNVDKEAVRVLAIEIGAREAARRLGIKEATVCAWSSRYKWKLPPRNQFAVSRGVEPNVSSLQSLPGDVLIATHKELESRTRTSMARATCRAAEEAQMLETVLPKTQQLQQLATAASRLFGWDTPQQNNTFNTLVVSAEQLEQIRQLRGT